MDTGLDLLGDPSCPLRLRAVFLEAFNVLKSVFHFVVHAVPRGKRLSPQRRQNISVLGRPVLTEHLCDTFAPRPGRTHQALFQFFYVNFRQFSRAGQPDPEEDTSQCGFSDPGLVVNAFGVERLAEFLLDPESDAGGVSVTGQVDHGGHEPAVDVRAQEQLGPPSLLETLDAGGSGGKIRYLDLEQFVAGIRFKDSQKILARVGVNGEPCVAQDSIHLVPNDRDVAYRSSVGTSGEKADEPPFTVNVAQGRRAGAQWNASSPW